jgi:hypothetical protein
MLHEVASEMRTVFNLSQDKGKLNTKAMTMLSSSTKSTLAHKTYAQRSCLAIFD